jgi:asparagine synthetase B (glutamine-hydrolysing)
MFAFSIYDTVKHELFVARDRIGVNTFIIVLQMIILCYTTERLYEKTCTKKLTNFFVIHFFFNKP